ncbi:hypothetical protein JCM16303_005221 [Sporobolomyces ruberrimus]
MSTLKAKQDQIRQQLNLKNLQRHDPLISEIVTSASYASVYENFGVQWVKTGIEGPMFLFSRTQAPHYGFFVLNRQGLEYIQEFLTPDCELNVGGEFILFESGQNADQATGIWIFDETERASLCKRMEQLRSAAAAVASTGTSARPPSPMVQAASGGQTVSLDTLFASSTTDSSSTPLAVPAVPPAAGDQPLATNPLDILFLNAAARNSPHLPPGQSPLLSTQPQSRSRVAPPSTTSVASSSALAIPKTLEQLFAAASPIPQSASLPFQALSHAQLSAPSPSMLPNTVPRAPVLGAGQPRSGGMSLLDSIFASATADADPQVSSPIPPTVSQPQASARSDPRPRAPNSDNFPAATAEAHVPLSMPGHPAEVQAVVPGGPTRPTPFSTLYPSPVGADQASGPREGTLVEADPPKSDDKEKPGRTSEEKKKPLFEAPLLSHDVFANLPLPSKGRSRERLSDTASVADAASRAGRDVAEEMGIKAEQADAVTEIQDEEVAVREAVSHVGETITDVLRSAPGPLPSIAPTRAAPNDDPHRSTGSSSPLQPPPRNARDSDRKPELLKSTVIGLVDTTIVEHGLSGDYDETNALDREEFVRQMFDVLKRPSVQIQLYGKYLERVEESQ